jgi:hypothetical protein
MEREGFAVRTQSEREGSAERTGRAHACRVVL